VVEERVFHFVIALGVRQRVDDTEKEAISAFLV